MDPQTPKVGYSDVVRTEKFGNYVCNYALDETPETIERSLTAFKDAILSTPDLEECVLTDNEILLWTLRFANYDIEKSVDLYVKISATIDRYPKFFKGYDIRDTGIADLSDRGWILKLPGTDLAGNPLFYLKVSEAKDPTLHGNGAPYRCIGVHLMSAALDPVMSARPWSVILDCKGGSLRQLSTLTLQDMIRFASASTTSAFRFHGIHFINTPFGPMKKILYMLLKYTAPHHHDKIVIHDKVDGLSQYVSLSNLPKECGGTVNLKDAIAEWKIFLESQREGAMRLEKSRLIVRSETSGKSRRFNWLP